MFLSYGE